jgi:alpha-beta hydrolase superfamily lysophospholipase
MEEIPHILSANGVQIPYYTWKVADPKASLIFIHGLKSHTGWFLETGEELARHSIKVYAFDRRGSGRSTERRGHIADFQDWLRDIRAMTQLARQENGGEIPHLLGHCFGAKLALAFALQYPQDVKSLTLIAPPQFSLKADITPLEKLKVLGTMLTGIEWEVEVPAKDEMFTKNPEKNRFIKADNLRLQKMTTTLCRETFKIDRWINKNLSQLTLPILVLLAKEDEIVDTPKIQRVLFKRLNGTQKAMEVYDCYHDLFFEPVFERVIARIDRWVKQESTPA